MTKIRELIKSICNIGGPFKPNWYSEDGIEKIMQEYARLMCDEQRKICVESADTRDDVGMLTFYGMPHTIIDSDSILNAPYPEELQ